MCAVYEKANALKQLIHPVVCVSLTCVCLKTTLPPLSAVCLQIGSAMEMSEIEQQDSGQENAVRGMDNRSRLTSGSV